MASVRDLGIPLVSRARALSMKRHQVLSRLWHAEWGLSVMLVFLVLAIFVAGPLVASEVAGSIWFDIAFALLLLSGVATVSDKKTLYVIALILVIASLGIRWASLVFPSRPILVIRELLSIASLGLFVALMLIQVFRSGPVTGYRIQGAIAVY
ncbi:MAG TPA: hypothetical protein VF376_01410, partial [Thermoanaerobaculia bacterium]